MPASPAATVNRWTNGARRWWRRCGELRRIAAFRRSNIGAHAYIDRTVQVLGWERVRVGHHTIIGEHTFLNVNERVGSEPAIVVGDNCFIGRRNFITASARVAIGDYCLTGPDCHFLGADHDISSPFVPMATTRAEPGAMIDVGANCWFGSSVIVLKNVRIGCGCILGAGALVTRDLPPFSIAVGSPARVVKRFDMRRKMWVALEEYPADGDRLLPTEAEYLADLRARFPAIKGPRAASSAAFGDFA